MQVIALSGRAYTHVSTAATSCYRQPEKIALLYLSLKSTLIATKKFQRFSSYNIVQLYVFLKACCLMIIKSKNLKPLKKSLLHREKVG